MRQQQARELAGVIHCYTALRQPKHICCHQPAAQHNLCGRNGGELYGGACYNEELVRGPAHQRQCAIHQQASGGAVHCGPAGSSVEHGEIMIRAQL